MQLVSMVKPQIRMIEAIVILLMLGVSPLSVTYSFAEIDSEKSREYGAIITEKMVDGKLIVSHHAISDELSKEDYEKKLSFKGQTSWAYVNYSAYNSGIVIFNGKITKIGDGLLNISTDKNIFEDLSFKVIFSEKNAEIDQENAFVLFLMNSVMKYPEITHDIKILHTGEMVINSEKSNGINQEFRNSVSVK
ncbi:MAG: hypothetical protein OEY10_04230 [Nitrosopumilus sp.]|nr:hypothetical protein [Nitrosopumilus sp.]